MSKWRTAAKVDDNQAEIVEELRKRGYSVEAGHDDILVGYQGKTYWYEIKDPNKTLKKDKTFLKGAVKPDQLRLLSYYKGHYKIVFTAEDIINDIENSR